MVRRQRVGAVLSSRINNVRRRYFSRYVLLYRLSCNRPREAVLTLLLRLVGRRHCRQRQRQRVSVKVEGFRKRLVAHFLLRPVHRRLRDHEVPRSKNNPFLSVYDVASVRHHHRAHKARAVSVAVAYRVADIVDAYVVLIDPRQAAAYDVTYSSYRQQRAVLNVRYVQPCLNLIRRHQRRGCCLRHY